MVFSHHHPDHTVNAALFPARRGSTTTGPPTPATCGSAGTPAISPHPSVRLVATPGHSNEDITTLAATPDGVYACTHAWWGPDGPAGIRSPPPSRR